MLGLVGLERGHEPGHLRRPVAVVAGRLGRVVPGTEVAQHAVGLLLRLVVVELVLSLLRQPLALLGQLARLCLDLVQESHARPPVLR